MRFRRRTRMFAFDPRCSSRDRRACRLRTGSIATGCRRARTNADTALGRNALDALADTDARVPAEQIMRTAALVVQPRERRLQAIDRDRTLPAERAERELAELAEREHDRPRHAQDRLRAAGKAEHVDLREVIRIDDLDHLATHELLVDALHDRIDHVVDVD